MTLWKGHLFFPTRTLSEATLKYFQQFSIEPQVFYIGEDIITLVEDA